MSTPQAPIKLRYAFQSDYPGSWTSQGIGAQAKPYRRGWYPQVPAVSGGSNAITALCRVRKWMYVGGSFAAPKAFLFRFNLEDGTVDEDFDLGLDNAVSTLATDGQSLWVGGSFTAPKAFLFRVNPDEAMDPAWPLAQPNGTVNAISVQTGTQYVHVGGAFTFLGSDARSYLAQLDSEGIATLFDAKLTGSNVFSLSFSVSSGQLYVGGLFSASNGTGRNNVLSLDPGTAALSTWNPNANGAVRQLVLAYPLAYAGGAFTTIGGQSRSGLACLDLSGAATTFNPGPGDTVNGLSLDPATGNVFYGDAAGLHGVDPSGAALPWIPGAVCSAVYCVLFYKASVFAGGSNWTQVNGIGSTTMAVGGGATVPFPLFRDDNTIFLKQTGSKYEDAGTGTYADPKRTMDGCVGTSPTFNDQSQGGAGTNHLTVTGKVPGQWENWVQPIKGRWMAGLFNDSNYLNVPAAVGAAINASNAFTYQQAFWIESMAAVNTLWDYQDNAADTVLSVGTNGSLSYNLRGTTATSAANAVPLKQWFTVIAEKNPSGNLKRAWIQLPGQVPALVINVTQSTTMGTHVSNRLCSDRSNAGNFLFGFAGPCFFFDTAISATVGVPADWRDSYLASCKGYWPMQTLSAVEKAVANRYVCILDSAVYEEAFVWHPEGCSLYAADNQAPVFQPRIGAKPGTYGARKVGREKFSAGLASTFIYVAKTGNDATGARGNPNLPFLTIAGASGAVGIAAGDTVQIQDSGIYTGDFTFGAAVTLQAADGQLPQVAQFGGVQLTITGAVNIYGVYLGQVSYAPTASVQLYDCSLIGCAVSFAALAGVSATLNGCLIDTPVAFSAALSSIVIKGCSFTASAGLTGTGTVVIMTVTGCSFGSNLGESGFSAPPINTSLASGNACLVAFCDFAAQGQNSAFGPHGGGISCVMDATCASFRAYACTFSAVGNPDGLVFFGGTSVQTDLCLAFLVGCLFDGGGYLCSAGFGGGWSGMKNCVVLGSPAAGVLSNGSVNQMVYLQNSAFLNCGAYGIYATPSTGSGISPVTQSTTYVYACSGSGSPIDLLFAGPSNYSFTAPYLVSSTFKVYGGRTFIPSTITTLFDGLDPGYLEPSPGAENVALSAASPCLFLPGTAGAADGGPGWGWIRNQASGAVLSGFAVSGPQNLAAGVENTAGVPTSLAFVSMSTLGVCGVFGRQGVDVAFCAGGNLNGLFLRAGGSFAAVENSIAWSCKGAGFVFGNPSFDQSHVSSWGCEYGSYDASLALGTFQDSIHSDNGVDVKALEPVDFSDVGSVAAGTSIGTGTIRKNPLYQNPFNGNLALQTLAGGYPFDSPAKGAASDGSDMGAYEAEYGPLSESFDELDFDAISTVDGVTPWRNPDDVPVTYQPIKLSESDKPAGGTYSQAKAIKRQFTLTWDPSSNDMPLDQQIALNEVYAAPAPVDIWIFGNWVRCVVLKSNQATNDQIDQRFTTQEVPRPFHSLTLREL